MREQQLKENEFKAQMKSAGKRLPKMKPFSKKERIQYEKKRRLDKR